jgi:hypothetical protein
MDNVVKGDQKSTNPRIIEQQDKYYREMYADNYSRTLTFVGFDRNASKVSISKTTLPQLIEWNAKVNYVVNGCVLSQPKDWAAQQVPGDAAGEGGGEGGADSGEGNVLVSSVDIDDLLSSPISMTTSSLKSTSTSTSASTPPTPSPSRKVPSASSIRSTDDDESLPLESSPPPVAKPSSKKAKLIH